MSVPEANPDKPDTKTALLDAAEEVFAQKGVEGGSLRAITERAGANLAAVNYHFGSKEGLVRAVFERRIVPMNRERLDRLDRLEEGAGDRPLAMAEIVGAFVDPVLHMAVGPNPQIRSFRQLMGRVYSESRELMLDLIVEQFQEVFLRFFQALSKALPQLSPPLVMARMHFMVGCMVQTMLNEDLVERQLCLLEAPFDARRMEAELKSFIVAGLQAPVSGEWEADEADMDRWQEWMERREEVEEP
ncbi:MAG: TetR/AcrR family transcriptional regulator [Acidobacteriota bacterium]|nr:TetR/AcrR family transcriptional regulator [Acidobacteriota bacterium]